MARGGDEIVAEGDAGCDLALIDLGRRLLFGAISCHWEVEEGREGEGEEVIG